MSKGDPLKPGDPRPKLRSSHGAMFKAERSASPKVQRSAQTGETLNHRMSSRWQEVEPQSTLPKWPRENVEIPEPKRARDLLESLASHTARETATDIAIVALEKKALGLEVLDVSGKVDYADFLLLMTGRSDRHVASLASAIEESLRKRGKVAISVEGMPHANWVLIDFGDVVVHIFLEGIRRAYDLDGLWMDAKRLPVPSDLVKSALSEGDLWVCES